MHNITIMEDDYCPVCGTIISAATPIDPKETYSPIPGDISICVGCTAYLLFDDNLKLKTLTVAEMIDLPNDIFLEITTKRTQLRSKQIQGFRDWQKTQTQLD